MNEPTLISVQTLCVHYDLEISFIDELQHFGLLQLHLVEEDQFIHQDQIGDLEKIIRLHKDLKLNLEGIDVVFNLLQKERSLKEEIIVLRNKLRLYESQHTSRPPNK